MFVQCASGLMAMTKILNTKTTPFSAPRFPLTFPTTNHSTFTYYKLLRPRQKTRTRLPLSFPFLVLNFTLEVT